MSRSNLRDFSDAYIVVKGIVTITADERDRDKMNRQVILKNNAPFISLTVCSYHVTYHELEWHSETRT